MLRADLSHLILEPDVLRIVVLEPHHCNHQSVSLVWELSGTASHELIAVRLNEDLLLDDRLLHYVNFAFICFTRDDR